MVTYGDIWSYAGHRYISKKKLWDYKVVKVLDTKNRLYIMFRGWDKRCYVGMQLSLGRDHLQLGSTILILQHLMIHGLYFITLSLPIE